MPESISGSAYSAPIVGSPILSQQRAAVFELQLIGLSAVEERALVFGSAASAPGSYAALTGSVGGLITEWVPLEVRLHPGGGGVDVHVRFEAGQSFMAGMTSGELVWACLFPISWGALMGLPATAPDLVLSLGLLT